MVLSLKQNVKVVETEGGDWHYQQNHLRLREESAPGTKCPKKDLRVFLCGNNVKEMENPLMIRKKKQIQDVAGT
jgi:hypothetical protein